MTFQTGPRHALHLFCLLGALALSVHSSLATSVLAPSFARLVAGADLIFTGQVIAQRAEWKEIRGQKSIVTLVTCGVQSVHKGQTGTTVTLQFLGGSVGGVKLAVAEMPSFTIGERVVLFVEGNGQNVSPLVGFYHGKFSIRVGAGGRESILKHDGRPLGDVTELGREENTPGKTAQGLTPEEFTGQIRALLARTGPH